MNSLESQIRSLMIAIAREHDEITYTLDKADPNDINTMDKLLQRRKRLSRLSTECIFNIDKEIAYFK